MLKPYIKICGLTDVKTAYSAAKLGADFIGLVFHSPSKRHVSIKLATQIVSAIKESGAISVGIFVEQTYEEVLNIIQTTKIQAVQLNGEKIKQTHAQLPKELIRIWAQPVIHNNYQDSEIKFNNLDKNKDFILFDYKNPGSGQSFNWDKFHYQEEIPWGVAGGLTPDNINLMLRTFTPHLIDVSSGVENQSGQKDLDLIKQFIANVKKNKI